jgi:hypothetical protein
MNERDDDDWLDALAGRDTSVSATRREALALRGAVLGANRTADNVVRLASRDARREQQLLERAAREGVIERVPPRRKTGLMAIAAGVALTLTTGLLIRMQTTQPDHEVVRGVEGDVVRLLAADPAALKGRILEALRAAGVEATGYEALGVHGIDADLPRPLTPAASRVLAQFGIPEPADGVLRIEIRSRE